MFNINDIIDYGFYSDIEIVGIDQKHYILKDQKGNSKKVYIDLVNKHGTLKIPGK